MSEANELTDLQQYAELGRISASLLHEMSTPLSAALLQLEQMQATNNPELEQVHQNMRSLQLYLEAARQQVSHSSQNKRFVIRPHVAQVERIIKPLARRAGTKLTIGPVPDCHLYGDPVKFQHILSNLLVNAVEAYPSRANNATTQPVKLTCKLKADQLVLRVSDKGTGISPDQLNQLFEPFYTTKQDTRGGLGIGLNIVKEYVNSFDGQIKVKSSRGSGTHFVATLPLDGSAHGATSQ